jgi:hypothetical protein
MADAIHSVPTFQMWGYLRFNGYYIDGGDIPTTLSSPYKFMISILPECRDAMYSVRSNPEWEYMVHPKLESIYIFLTYESCKFHH